MAETGNEVKYPNSPNHGFLGYLTPAVVPHCHCRGRDQSLDDYKEAETTIGKESGSLLVTGVGRTAFKTHFLETETSPFSRWAAYDRELEVLLIRMTKHPAHESASRTFNTILLDAIDPMGLEYFLVQIGSSTRFGAGGAKEADEAWTPKHVPRDRSHTWPSVVLEVAYSERQRNCKTVYGSSIENPRATSRSS
ncbi:hypothetical protein BDW60DRAFT_208426 [Aspergillus nidulans var. acristatus]